MWKRFRILWPDRRNTSLHYWPKLRTISNLRPWFEAQSDCEENVNQQSLRQHFGSTEWHTDRLNSKCLTISVSFFFNFILSFCHKTNRKTFINKSGRVIASVHLMPECRKQGGAATDTSSSLSALTRHPPLCFLLPPPPSLSALPAAASSCTAAAAAAPRLQQLLTLRVFITQVKPFSTSFPISYVLIQTLMGGWGVEEKVTCHRLFTLISFAEHTELWDLQHFNKTFPTDTFSEASVHLKLKSTVWEVSILRNSSPKIDIYSITTHSEALVTFSNFIKPFLSFHRHINTAPVCPADIWAENMALTSPFRDKLGCHVLWTLGWHLMSSLETCYVFLLGYWRNSFHHETHKQLCRLENVTEPRLTEWWAANGWKFDEIKHV